MKRWLLVSIALTLLATAASLVVWVNREAWLPEQVTVHWDTQFKPDKSVPRDGMFWYLLAVPASMAFMVLLLQVLPWLSPEHFKVDAFRATYDYIAGLLIAMFAYMHGVVLALYTGQVHDVGRWLIGGSLLFLALLGNVLGKVQRNFWMGVRTPWTLASETVWIRTHRLAAWLFVAAGLIGFVLVLLGVNPLLALALFIVAAIAPVFYSLVLYKYLEKRGRLGEGAGAQPQ
jgi:uncharacterized membrane protein